MSGTAVPPASQEKPLTEYTLEEIAKHNTETDCWTIIDSKVYDVTKFLAGHPGGKDIMVSYSGKDSTEMFDVTVHSPKAKEMMKKYLIGKVKIVAGNANGNGKGSFTCLIC